MIKEFIADRKRIYVKNLESIQQTEVFSFLSGMAVVTAALLFILTEQYRYLILSVADIIAFYCLFMFKKQRHKNHYLTALYHHEQDSSNNKGSDHRSKFILTELKTDSNTTHHRDTRNKNDTSHTMHQYVRGEKGLINPFFPYSKPLFI